MKSSPLEGFISMVLSPSCLFHYYQSPGYGFNHPMFHPHSMFISQRKLGAISVWLFGDFTILCFRRKEPGCCQDISSPAKVIHLFYISSNPWTYIVEKEIHIAVPEEYLMISKLIISTKIRRLLRLCSQNMLLLLLHPW